MAVCASVSSVLGRGAFGDQRITEVCWLPVLPQGICLKGIKWRKIEQDTKHSLWPLRAHVLMCDPHTPTDPSVLQELKRLLSS